MTTDSDRESELRAYVGEYEGAWNRHDAGALAAFFGDDADMVMGNLPAVQGRDAIGRWWAAYFEAFDSDRVGTFTIETIRLLSDDVAMLNIGSSNVPRGASGSDVPPRLARGTWVLLRGPSRWSIEAMRGLPATGESPRAPATDS